MALRGLMTTATERRPKSADQIVAAVHERDSILRTASAWARLGKKLAAEHKQFGHQEMYGMDREKTFRPMNHSDQKRIAELAIEHAKELLAKADEIMKELDQ